MNFSHETSTSRSLGMPRNDLPGETYQKFISINWKGETTTKCSSICIGMVYPKCWLDGPLLKWRNNVWPHTGSRSPVPHLTSCRKVIITVSNYRSCNKTPFSSKLQNVSLISLRVNAFPPLHSSWLTVCDSLGVTRARGLPVSYLCHSVGFVLLRVDGLWFLGGFQGPRWGCP